MIRIAKFAAIAAVLAAATPAAAESITVSTHGKTAAQVNAEVAQAARTVCRREMWQSVSGLSGYSQCIALTIAEARNSQAYIKLASR